LCGVRVTAITLAERAARKEFVHVDVAVVVDGEVVPGVALEPRSRFFETRATRGMESHTPVALILAAGASADSRALAVLELKNKLQGSGRDPVDAG